MSALGNLPTCSIQHPACGACGGETSYDGDSFYCEPCGLDYGDGSETRATYRDEDAEPCGHPCDNCAFQNIALPCLCQSAYQPCALPAGHESGHWHPCKPCEVLDA